MRLEHLLSGAVPLMAGQALQEAPGDDAKNGEKPLKSSFLRALFYEPSFSNGGER